MSMQQSEGGEPRPWHQRRSAAREARRRQEREEIAEAVRLGVAVIPKLRIDRFWTEKEDAIIVKYRYDMNASLTSLPGRTKRGINARRKTLGVIWRQQKIWTSKEEKIIREGITKVSNTRELAALLPGRTTSTVRKHLAHMGLKIIPPAPDTGSAVIDAIKARCRALGYTMKDLDNIAKTGNYFCKRNWKGRDGSTMTSTAISKAVNALGGTLRVDWPDDGESIDTIDVGEG